MAEERFDRQNRDARERLAGLVALLTPDQLRVDVGDGWTVALVLAHLAFWDRWQVARWRDAEARGLSLPEPMPAMAPIVNTALEVILGSIPDEKAGRLALEAAAEIDGLVADLPQISVRAAIDAGNDRLANRAAHRLEHIAQIERALETD